MLMLSAIVPDIHVPRITFYMDSLMLGCGSACADDTENAEYLRPKSYGGAETFCLPLLCGNGFGRMLHTTKFLLFGLKLDHFGGRRANRRRLAVSVDRDLSAPNHRCTEWTCPNHPCGRQHLTHIGRADWIRKTKP
ncbi:hypothetical protein AVEN_181147-1 [Araneus ventricosus]|uniref:Uncharacterized protein n=1 Tax=Araneus ventricosus TaxID=182803 RepID=A0A4Y2KMV7_ARAVE|nr:hypothetical protein AVEN_181147-1 [Araneus ventricosus]